MSVDPYAPPAADAAPAGAHLPLREIVLGWEKLRLFYNAVLALPGGLMIWHAVSQEHVGLEEAVISALLVAIGANLGFFLGPLAELYLRGLFLPGSFGRGRQLLFGLGLMFSGCLFALIFLLANGASPYPEKWKF